MSIGVWLKIMKSPGCATGPAWSLLVSMANRASDDGTGIFASLKTLARDCGMGERTAWRALPKLLKSGLVVDTGKKHDCKMGTLHAFTE